MLCCQSLCLCLCGKSLGTTELDTSPVSIRGHRALDDDDLPGVKASRYGPRVRDHLRWTVDIRPRDTCTDTSWRHADWIEAAEIKRASLISWNIIWPVVRLRPARRPFFRQLLTTQATCAWFFRRIWSYMRVYWSVHDGTGGLIIISLLPDSERCVSRWPQTSGSSGRTPTNSGANVSRMRLSCCPTPGWWWQRASSLPHKHKHTSACANPTMWSGWTLNNRRPLSRILR